MTLRERRRARWRAVRPALWWTVAVFVIAVVISVAATRSLVASDQACFLGSQPPPCPEGDDPRIAWLTFAFFGMPVVWLLGLLLLAVRGTTRGRG